VTITVASGARNWWMPRWLDRLVPRLSAEGTAIGAGADGHDDAPSRDEAETAKPVPGSMPVPRPQPVVA
jgi:putative drug exporter of the RND superfamily